MTFSQQNQNAQESDSESQWFEPIDKELNVFNQTVSTPFPTSIPIPAIAIKTTLEEDFADYDGVKRDDLVNVFGNYMLMSHNKFSTKEIMNWIFDEYKIVDWDIVSQDPNLTNPIMNAFAIKINWTLISKRKDLSEETIRLFRDDIKFEFVRIDKLSNEFIKEFIEELDLISILQYQNNLSDDITELLIKNIKWKNICSEFSINDEIIIKFSKQLDWEVLSEYLLFTNNIVSKMRGLIRWEILSKRKLSHNFLKTASSRVDWKLVCQYSNLNDASIHLFKDEFTKNDTWDVIVRYQELSAEILGEFINKFDFELVQQFQQNSVSILVERKMQRRLEIKSTLENELKEIDVALRLLQN